MVFNSMVKSCRNALHAVSALSLLALVNTAHAAYEYNLPEQVTPLGREITNLHNTIFIICLVILILVSGAMFYSIFAHRKSRGVEPATFSHSTKVEIIWTVVPVLILIGMAVPATDVLIKMEDTTQSDLTVKVTGYQWKWQYQYLDSDVDFYSTLSTPREQIDQYVKKTEQGVNYLQEVDNHMVIPSGKKVRLLLTANDVIHAWWVPKLGGKKDAIPGYINEMWIKADVGKEGTYRGRCAELCGKDHAYMPIVVDVVSQEDFDKWVAANEQAASSDIKNVAEVLSLGQQQAALSTDAESSEQPAAGAPVSLVSSSVENAASN